MHENFEPNVVWPSGDCLPVLATKMTPEDLSSRFEGRVFRAKDDLDWFSGVLIEKSDIGQILIMRHDNNPEKLTAFYVDVNQDVSLAQIEIAKKFLLTKDEIAWRREV